MRLRNKAYLSLEPALQPDNVARVLHEGAALPGRPGLVRSGGVFVEKPEVRRVTTRFFSPDAHRWLFELMRDIGSSMNERHFGFDLTCVDDVLLLEYSADDAGHYDWHADFVARPICRKLSLCIQLSPPDDYEGGQLELMLSQTNRIVALRERGCGLMFPSWQLHRVTPVARGVRRSLVTWLSGPEFR
jgi:PKHD-type hydroxylase